MKILISTPAFGGLVHTGYLNSLIGVMTSREVLTKHQVSIATISNDALVQRARNELTKMALDLKVDKMLFVDADITFTPQDFMRVADSPHEIIGGTYRKKSLEPILNFNLRTDIEKKMREKYGIPSSTPAGWKILKQEFADKDGCVEALHLPTGFLCIHMDVIRKIIAEKGCAMYASDRRDAVRMQYSEEEMEKMLVPEIYTVGVCSGSKVLGSEDWLACELFARHGYKIYLDTNIVCPHTGSLTLAFPL